MIQRFSPRRRLAAVTFAVVGLFQSMPERALAQATQPAAKPAAPSDAWPLFRGESTSRGVSASSLPEKPELLWERTFDDESFESTAIVHEGTIYLGGFERFFAIDLATGKDKWSVPSEIGFAAPASVREGKVYVGDLDGVFRCLDAATGKELWSFRAEAQIDNGANFHKDRVLFGSQDATLYCLQADSGEVVWKHQIADQIRCFPTIVEDRCFVAGCDGELHIIDLAKGEAVATVNIEGPTRCTPAVVGDVAYVGGEAETFFAIDWRRANLLWKTQGPSRGGTYRSSAAVAEGVVAVGNQGNFLLGLDAATGKEVWTYNTRGDLEASPVIVGDRVFCASTRGRLFAVDLKSGEERWSYEAGGGFRSSPAVASGRLVIGGDNGALYCFGEKAQ